MAQAPKISKYNLYLSSNFDMFFFFELIVYWTSSVIQANFFDQMCFQVNLIAVKLVSGGRPCRLAAVVLCCTCHSLLL